MAEEDSISFTLAEFGKFQVDMLNLKHENQRLKPVAQKYNELLKISQNPLQDLLNQQKTHSADKTQILEQLKTLKQGQMTEQELKLSQEILSILNVTEPIKERAESFLMQQANQKLSLAKESLQIKCTALQTSLQETLERSFQQEQTNTSLISELKTQKQNLILDLASREQEITAARENLKEKYAVECVNQELQQANQKLKEQIKQLQNNVQSLTEQAKSKEELEKLSKENSVLKKELAESKTNQSVQLLQYENLKTSAKKSLQELNEAQNQIGSLNQQIQSLNNQVKKLKIEVEDTRTEKQIVQKRSMHDMKDLKTELAKETTAHEHCKMEKETLYQEVRRLQDLQRNLVKAPQAGMTEKEKIIVEHLAQRVQELESQNAVLNGKLGSVLELEAELERYKGENEVLQEDISRLQLDLATLGASFNQMLRSGSLK